MCGLVSWFIRLFASPNILSHVFWNSHLYFMQYYARITWLLENEGVGPDDLWGVFYALCFYLPGKRICLKWIAFPPHTFIQASVPPIHCFHSFNRQLDVRSGQLLCWALEIKKGMGQNTTSPLPLGADILIGNWISKQSVFRDKLGATHGIN